MKLKELLTEVLGHSSIPFTSNYSKTIWEAEATLTSGDQLSFEAEYHKADRGSGYWTILFRVNDSIAVTNNKHNALEVYSLVLTIMQKFCEETNAVYMMFSGDNSHQKFYKRLMRNSKQMQGWTHVIHGTDKMTHFVIRKPSAKTGVKVRRERDGIRIMPVFELVKPFTVEVKMDATIKIKSDESAASTLQDAYNAFPDLLETIESTILEATKKVKADDETGPLVAKYFSRVTVVK